MYCSVVLGKILETCSSELSGTPQNVTLKEPSISLSELSGTPRMLR